MKKISITLTDVEVQLIRFVQKDPYEGFDVLENRITEDVRSEIEEIQKLQASVPIALFKDKDGAYIMITTKQEESVAG